MVKIRLSQTGKRNAKQYRIVVQEESTRRNGNCIETLGYYNPLVKPPAIEINRDRLAYWQKVGAVTTDGVNTVLKLAK